MIIVFDSDTEIAEEDLAHEMAYFGVLPRCQLCERACKQYNAPGLGLFICRASPDYEKYAAALNT